MGFNWHLNLSGTFWTTDWQNADKKKIMSLVRWIVGRTYISLVRVFKNYIISHYYKYWHKYCSKKRGKKRTAFYKNTLEGKDLFKSFFHYILLNSLVPMANSLETHEKYLLQGYLKNCWQQISSALCTLNCMSNNYLSYSPAAACFLSCDRAANFLEQG